ncbi:hypothetical protein C6P46_007015 [Rhodotorula mucilaginosa]|uniref:DM2 domain-containing protein n=1 Tax=Rhodotorula mucilaginosa TaxID=5537 RepID=A0A9P6VX88_RHOMI|nr:hypothetical protein C6P46_007015 [Rhodotorula mucilaginosa]TKA50555.1 hypothetical protein B0A53_06046 [Rhodotorula sp. CCFEE 5036]
MSYTQQQQQAAWVAHLQQQQQARGLAPLTPQQIAHLAAQLHSRQATAAQATGQQQGQGQQGGPPAGITSHERPLTAGAADHAPPLPASAPTDRSLPLAFTTRRPGPSDDKLRPSLEALEQLANSYADLQHLERRLDWTLARKQHQVTEQATTPGQPFKRTLRVHVLATVHDQSWQLDPEKLAAQADPSSSSSGPTPRVELRISGQLLDDPRYPASSTPFTQFVQRLVVETPSRDPATYPVGSQPLTWTRPPPASSSDPAPPQPDATNPLPALLTTSFPTSSSTLSLRLAVYPSHPAGDRYALHPELAAVLDCAESDRLGVLEALWNYAKTNGLVVEMGGGGEAPAPGAGTGAGAAASALKSGIKTDERIAKFFGNMGMVAFHHVPEYLNRWLMPPSPRLINLVVLVDPAAPTTQHTAYDLDIYVPDPSRPALEACARSLASLSSPPTTTTSSSSSSPSSPSSAAAEELASLDAQIALDCLTTTTHLRQLHALLSFTRDPVSFLSHFIASQAGSLEQILGAGGGGGATIAPVGMDKVLGERWRDEIRRSETWDSSNENEGAGAGAKGWLEDAIAVWAMREKEGEAQRLRQQQQQHQHAAAVAAMQYGRR